jgi:hypothetical protein
MNIKPRKLGENKNSLLVKFQPCWPTMRSTIVCGCVGLQSEYHWPGNTVIALPRRKPQLYGHSWKLDEVLKLTLLQGLALIALQFRFQRSILFFSLNWNSVDNMVEWWECLSVRSNASSRNLTQPISHVFCRFYWGVPPEIYRPDSIALNFVLYKLSISAF